MQKQEILKVVAYSRSLIKEFPLFCFLSNLKVVIFDFIPSKTRSRVNLLTKVRDFLEFCEIFYGLSKLSLTSSNFRFFENLKSDVLIFESLRLLVLPFVYY